MSVLKVFLSENDYLAAQIIYIQENPEEFLRIAKTAKKKKKDVESNKEAKNVDQELNRIGKWKIVVHYHTYT